MRAVRVESEAGTVPLTGVLLRSSSCICARGVKLVRETVTPELARLSVVRAVSALRMEAGSVPVMVGELADRT